MYLGSATPHIQSERSFSATQSYGSHVFSLHPLTQNDQVRLGNTYGEGRVLGQPRHCFARVCQRGSYGY